MNTTQLYAYKTYNHKHIQYTNITDIFPHSVCPLIIPRILLLRFHLYRMFIKYWFVFLQRFENIYSRLWSRQYVNWSYTVLISLGRRHNWQISEKYHNIQRKKKQYLVMHTLYLHIPVWEQLCNSPLHVFPTLFYFFTKISLHHLVSFIFRCESTL